MIAALWASPIVRKVALYGAIALASLWLMRIWSNKQYDKGFESGKQKGIADSIEAHQKDWDAQQNDLESLRKGLLEERASLDKEKATVLQNRVAIVNTLTAGQAKLATKIDELKPFVANVPESELDAEIRKALVGLR